MRKSGIPSPARSQGAAVTPRRYKHRGPRSVGSPARSDVSGRLTSVIKLHKNPFVMSPMPTRRSVLADTTDIEEPKRRSWWKQLGENSREVMEVIENNEDYLENDNVEELIEMEVLSQEKKSYHLDLPESSGSESIHSIVMPQRELFKQKENEPQKNFGELVGSRETLPKHIKTSVSNDKTISIGTRELFQNKTQRNKPIFPAALLDISLNDTVADKAKDIINEPPKNQVRNIFGNRAPTRKRNMFAEFIVSESEDEIPDIQPKIFEFSKKIDPKRRGSGTSRGIREPSPASSITTDMEMDDWKQLPSSTMVAEQLEEVAFGTPVKRARLSKLSEVKETDPGTNTDATDKTKSNKSVSSRNKSKNSSAIRDKSLELNVSMITRNAVQTIQSKNIKGNKALDTSLKSNNKSKNANSSLNRRNSKNTNQSLNNTNNKNKILEKSNQNVSKGKTIYFKENNDNIPNRIEDNEINAEIGDNFNNDEINFTLEYQSDDEQETVAPNINDNKSLKNKTRTLRRDSSKIHNAVASPEKQEIDLTIKKLHSTYKNTVEETKGSKMTKEKTEEMKKTVFAENKTNNEKTMITNDDVSIESGNRTQVYKILGKNDNMELNEIQNQDDTVGEQMEIHQINETSNNTKKKSAVNSKMQNICQDQEDFQQMQETPHANQEYAVKLQMPYSINLHVDNNKQNDKENRDENVNCKFMENNQKTPCGSDENGKPETQIGRNLENCAELTKKGVNSKVPQEINKSNISKHTQINEIVEQDEYEVVGIETEEQNEYEVVEQNANEVKDRNKNGIAEHSECDIDKPCDQNESESEDHIENNIEDENEVAEKHANSVEQQNEVESEEHNESEAEEQNESEVKEQNESGVEELIKKSEAEEQNKSDVEEQNTSDVEEQNESEADGQNESEVNEQNESEVEAQNESEIEEQNESEVEEQDESEVEEQSGSESEEQNESEVQEQNESEAEEQNENEAEEDNESEVEEQNESKAEKENQSEEEQDNSKPNALDENEEEMYNVSKEAIHNESHEESENIIERTETYNSTEIKLPEAVLHDKSNQGDSFTTQRRNTSIRKSKSMIKPLGIRPSLTPPRDSIGFSDGSKNSSTGGSGWDSHRTTRKTLRQTFGKDFTPRKSLRALVMEKSTKRHTAYMEGHAEMMSLPQANSTEFPEMSNRYDDVEETVESDDELSRRTRQAALEMCLEQIKKKKMEQWERVGEKVRNMFMTSNKENKRFKEFKPMFESTRTKKQVKNKKDNPLSTLLPMEYLPPEILEDMKYKPPKRFQPRNVSWITKRLYKFLEAKLEPKYDYKARVRAEKLVETIYNFAKGLKRQQVAPTDAVEVLKHEMARLDIVRTHFEFYEFFREYTPREIRVKVIPDIVNKIPMPKHGIFSEILR